MADQTKSSEQIIRSVFSSISTSSAGTYSSEEVIRGVYNGGSSAINVIYNSADNAMAVKYV